MFEKLRENVLNLHDDDSISCCIETTKKGLTFRGFLDCCEIETPNKETIIISSSNGNMMIIERIDDDKITFDYDDNEFKINYGEVNIFIAF